MTGVSVWDGPNFSGKPKVVVFPSCILWVVRSSIFQVALKGLSLGVVCEKVHSRSIFVFDDKGKDGINVRF